MMDALSKCPRTGLGSRHICLRTRAAARAGSGTRWLALLSNRAGSPLTPAPSPARAKAATPGQVQSLLRQTGDAGAGSWALRDLIAHLAPRVAPPHLHTDRHSPNIHCVEAGDDGNDQANTQNTVVGVLEPVSGCATRIRGVAVALLLLY
jgi:hypothetical protein